MSLIECPECKKEVSDRIESCIHCGYPLGEEKNIGWLAATPKQSEPELSKPEQSKPEQSKPEQSKPEQSESYGKMFIKKIAIILSFLVGVSLIFLGLIFLIQQPISSIPVFLASLIFISPVRKYFHAKTKITLAPAQKLLAVLISLFLSIVMMNVANDQEETKKAEQLKIQEAVIKKNIDYFNKNAEKILKDIRHAFEIEDYESALQLSNKHVITKNPLIMSLNKKAREGLNIHQNKRKIEELVTKLKKIPASNLIANRDNYATLVTLNPNEKIYKEKLDYYTQKLNDKIKKEAREKEKEEKVSADRTAKYGPRPIANPWTGGYFVVQQHLEQNANDPDSIDIIGCTGMNVTKKGWLVGCKYRGRNGFGGMVIEMKWFTIRFNTVVEVEEANAYNLD
jgi:hypothetical protein